jgi:hypothetical protein
MRAAPTAAPGPPFGVDINGNQSINSLLPRGWQRSGAGPAVRAHNRAAASGLAHTNDPVLTAGGQEAALATAVVADNTGVVLIWSFSVEAGASSTAYVFSQIPQQVLPGDSATLAALSA